MGGLLCQSNSSVNVCLERVLQIPFVAIVEMSVNSAPAEPEQPKFINWAQINADRAANEAKKWEGEKH